MIAHLDHGTRLHARIPFPFNVMGSKYEYVLMKVLGKLTDMDWIYRHRAAKGLVDMLANRVVLPLIHGEVLNPDEVENMVLRLEAEGHVMALGTCECRHGMNMLEEEEVEGRDPNLTCVMIGDWGRGHLYAYPRQYRHTSARELVDLARFWHRNGRVLTAWGCSDLHGFLISYCHCHPDYCVPLRNQLKRGNRVFYPGYNFARVDGELCRGGKGCGTVCVGRCHFGAIEIVDGSARVDEARCHGCAQCYAYCPNGAVSLVPRPGHSLSYCPPDLLLGSGPDLGPSLSA